MPLAEAGIGKAKVEADDRAGPTKEAARQLAAEESIPTAPLGGQILLSRADSRAFRGPKRPCVCLESQYSSFLPESPGLFSQGRGGPGDLGIQHDSGLATR